MQFIQNNDQIIMVYFRNQMNIPTIIYDNYYQLIYFFTVTSLLL